MKTFNKSYVADHKYAQSNGYTGSFDDFVNLQYELYVTIRIRNGIIPKSKEEWSDSKND